MTEVVKGAQLRPGLLPGQLCKGRNRNKACFCGSKLKNKRCLPTHPPLRIEAAPNG